jgi:hypothetical protein
MSRRWWIVALGGSLLIGGEALADHTKEDAQRTTAKLEAILHPHKPRPTHERVVESEPPAKVAAKVPTSEGGDPIWSSIEYCVRLAFDGHTLEAHLRNLPKTPDEIAAHLDNIPKTPDEVAAHLRRLNRALARKR